MLKHIQTSLAILISFAFILGGPYGLLATQSFIAVKDANGAVQNYQVTVDGSGYYLTNTVICDATAGATCAKVVAGSSAGIADPAIVVADPNVLAAALAAVPGYYATAYNTCSQSTGTTAPICVDLNGNMYANISRYLQAAGSPSTTLVMPVQGTVGGTPVTVGAAMRASPTWTVQAAGYSSGNSLGGLITATITANNAQTGFLTNVRITDVHGDTSPTLTIFLYDTTPASVGSYACTDKSAFVNDPGTIDSLIAQPQTVTLAVPTGATYSSASVDFTPPRAFMAGASAKTIFACVIVNGSLTPNATTDFHISFGAALN